FQLTTELAVKPVPLTVSVNDGPPGATAAGTSGLFANGTGLFPARALPQNSAPASAATTAMRNACSLTESSPVTRQPCRLKPAHACAFHGIFNAQGKLSCACTSSVSASHLAFTVLQYPRRITPPQSPIAMHSSHAGPDVRANVGAGFSPSPAVHLGNVSPPSGDHTEGWICPKATCSTTSP